MTHCNGTASTPRSNDVSRIDRIVSEDESGPNKVRLIVTMGYFVTSANIFAHFATVHHTSGTNIPSSFVSLISQISYLNSHLSLDVIS